MGKLTKYVIVMSGLVLLFYFTGLLPSEATVNSTLLGLLLEPETLADEPIALKTVIVMQAILATAIVAGFAIAGNIELGVMSAFAIYLFNLLWDFTCVYVKVSQVNVVFATLFFAPILLLYIITIIEWWRGRD